jgi:hypothetical protein
MDIFISHNSRDKIKALRLRDSLTQDGHAVWMDTHEIRYGETIADAVLSGLEKADLIVVLWSTFSSASKGVAHEITHARSMGKRTIFCLLDKTPVPAEDGEFGDLAMHFYNFQSGLAVLRGEIIEMQYQALPEKDAALDDIMPVQREASKLHEHFSREDLRGTTKDEDKAAMLRQCLRMYMKVPSVQRQPDSQAAYDFLNKLLDALEENLHNPAALIEIQKKLQSSPYASHKIGLMVQHTIASVLSASNHPEESTQQPVTADILNTYARQFDALLEDARPLLMQALRENFPGADAHVLVEALHYYLASSIEQIRHLDTQAGQSADNKALKCARDHLMDYLQRPDDLIDDSAGIWGYFDDVWLIQNVAYRCIEAGILPSPAVDWQRIQTGDAVLLGLFNPQVTQALQNYLVNVIEEIQQHLPAYEPAVDYNPQVPFTSMNGVQQSGGNALLDQAFATMLLHSLMAQQQQPQGGQCFEDQVVAMGFGSLL